MELRFLLPELRRMDEPTVELCACTLWSDERPLREESAKVGAELRSLRERKSNIPKRNLDIRRLLYPL